jgi:hypothetical protein
MGGSIILLDRKNSFILFWEGVVVHIGSLLFLDFFSSNVKDDNEPGFGFVVIFCYFFLVVHKGTTFHAQDLM